MENSGARATRQPALRRDAPGLARKPRAGIVLHLLGATALHKRRATVWHRLARRQQAAASPVANWSDSARNRLRAPFPKQPGPGQCPLSRAASAGVFRASDELGSRLERCASEPSPNNESSMDQPAPTSAAVAPAKAVHARCHSSRLGIARCSVDVTSRSP
jgi:hypothetical protein